MSQFFPALDSAALPVMGWREWVSLPELKVPKIKVKVDTGARTSALHAFDLDFFEIEGQDIVRFTVHPQQGDITQTIVAQAPLFEYREVRNSGGQAECRPVIITTVHLGDRAWPIELTLTNRDVMGFRMLLGRQAIRHHFLVDPGRSYLLHDKIEQADKG